jgi:hypothetical protein
MKNNSKKLHSLSALLALSGWLLAGCKTSTATRDARFQIGDATVNALVAVHDSRTPTLVNVHDDENTSVLAGRAVLKESPGRIIELCHTGKRFVTFKLGEITNSFDPNRIFSDAGIRETLSRRGDYSVEAHAAVKIFATALIRRFELVHEPVIIALHNTDGRGLTIQSYLKEGDKSDTSSRVHVSERQAAGDFFYVTDERFFDFLKARDFNVTLQDDANVPDDGSLSVYFARKGIPYVNIEADMHHLAEQTEMVRVALAMVRELGLTD